MITKVSSVNYINGQRYRNVFIEQVIGDILKEQKMDGLKGFKMYLDESNLLLPILNIVIMVNKNYELMNMLDGSLKSISEKLESEFRFTKEKMFLFIIWK